VKLKIVKIPVPIRNGPSEGSFPEENMNKRKTRGGASRDRPGPTRSNSTKTPDRETREMPGKDDCEGVYRNARFTHSVTSLIGNALRVETQNNKEFEGILKTFSPQLEMVLEWVHEIDPKMPDCINYETVKEKMVFPIKDIVRYYALDVDLGFATKEDFQTDSQISANRINGETPMKQLQEWVPEGEDESHDLEEGGGGLGGNGNGWSPHEMFAKNAEFGVETTFDPNLSGYTVQLSSKGADTADWREKERKAAAIAAEIEGNSNSKAAIELENGDEEEAFSAVVRGRGGQGNRDRERESPGHGDQGEKPYVPPGRRDERGPRDNGSSQRGRGGRGARTTPPGSRTTPPPRYEREHRDSHDDGYRGNRYDRSYSGGRGAYNNERGDRHSSDRYDRGYNNDYRGDGGNRGGDRYNRQDSHSRDHRQGERSDRSYNRPQSSQKEERDKKVSPLPEPERSAEKPPTDRRKSSEGVRAEPPRAVEPPRVGDGARVPPEDAGLPQRGERGVRKGEKSREQVNTELKDFNEKFNLANQTSPSLATTPTVSVKTGGSVGGTPLPSPQPGTPAADTAGPTTPQPVSPGQPTTPVANNSSPPSQGSMSDSAKKSTLNPNAKEFSFNPTAKEFTPRGPSGPRVAPTPPRPQTPSTPNSMGVTQAFGGGYITLAPGPGQVGMNHVNVNSPMFVPHQQHMQMAANSMGQMQIQQQQQQQQQLGVVTSQYLQNTRPMGNNQRQQGKESGNSGGRPDLPSPMAVTGHPILAGGVTTLTGQPPHAPQHYFNPGQAVYGQPQGHPVVRMITMPSGGVPGAMIPGMMPMTGMTSSHADTITQPTMSGTHNMWAQPTPHPPPSGVPPPIAATPPNHGTQPNTPAPSPGLQQMYPGHGHPPQPASLPPNYPQPGQGPTLMVIPGGGFPGHIPTSGAPQQGMPPHMGQHALMGGPGGQPVTSMANMMPHFQYMQQHQGGQPHLTHLMAQQHNQQ